jgi:hypothetical protein
MKMQNAMFNECKSSCMNMAIGRACAPLHRAVHIDHGKFLVTARESSALDK